jgi:hypothetical protein
VAADGAGNVYAAGSQQGTGVFDYGNGVSAQGPNSYYTVVLVKYNSAGVTQWAKTIVTGSGDSAFNAVAADGAGNVYAAGSQQGAGVFDYGNGVSAQGTHVGANVVLVKYPSD